MEQLNKVLPDTQEELNGAAERVETSLLEKVRSKFGFFGTISLIFGGILALLFYKTWIGLNVLLFTAVIVALICIIMKRLSRKIKTWTKFYFAGAILLGISSCLTSNAMLLFLNIIGILILFDLILLYQFYENGKWDFIKHFSRMVSLVFYSIASIALPFVDGINFLRRVKILKNDKIKNVVMGFIIAIPFLFIITFLLSEADILFQKLTGKLFDTIFSTDIFTVTSLILLGFLFCYSVLCGALMQSANEKIKPVKRADAAIAVTFLSVLGLVYAIFCSIQIIYLFANGYFVLPQEFTFSEYARRGFFELLAVTVINIILMLLCNAFFKDSKPLRLLLTFITICTYILIASSAYRMLLYISAYHLTFQRLFVLLLLIIDAFVLAGVIRSQFNNKFPLFQYCVAVTTICYLIFSLAKPDYYIADYLINQKETLDIEDMRFLTEELSLDAAAKVLPVLNDEERWLEEEGQEEILLYTENEYQDNYNINSKSHYIDKYYNRIEEANKNTGFRAFNYSNYKAVGYANQYPK